MTFEQWWKTASFPWMDSVPKHWFEAVWNAGQSKGFEAGIAYQKLANLSAGLENAK